MAWIVKNEGSAEFRGPHSCRVEFQLQNTATGEIIRDRKTMRVKSHTKTERARCIRERRAELESGLRLDASSVTFSQYADEWLATRKADPEISPRTYSKDEYRVRVLKLQTAQYLMGHDDPATTLKIYAHYMESNGEKAAAAVGALMDSLPSSNLVRLEKPKGRWGLKAIAV